MLQELVAGIGGIYVGYDRDDKIEELASVRGREHVVPNEIKEPKRLFPLTQSQLFTAVCQVADLPELFKDQGHIVAV